MHVYRWDLDKTYLDTDFASLRGLMRAATESATQKRCVPGATALLSGLAAQRRTKVAILSGSPKQMRGVIEQKLSLDGIEYDSLTLKDNLHNIKHGRFRAIRGQFGYKLPALFKARQGLGHAVGETLFGDDAEADALIYSVYADAISGEISAANVSRILEMTGAYPDQISDALRCLRRVSKCEAVEHIFIHLDYNSPPSRFLDLSRVLPVFSWWQAALVLYAAGRLDVSGVETVMNEVMEVESLDRWAMVALAQDMIRRNHVTWESIRCCLEKCGIDIDVSSSTHGDIEVSSQHRRKVDYLKIVREWG